MKETASGIPGEADRDEAALGGLWPQGGCGVSRTALDSLAFKQSSTSHQHLMMVS